MIVTLDTEFLDDGKTIELLSIALVAADGREYYGVAEGADLGRVLTLKDPWVWNNVVLKHLPVIEYDSGAGWLWDDEHPDFERVIGREWIAKEVEAFMRATPEPELWAYYSATDHVAGYQLFGSMIEASRDYAWPMRTSCLKQEEVQLRRRIEQAVGPQVAEHSMGVNPRPVQDEKSEHHALYDARHDMDLARWLGLV